MTNWKKRNRTKVSDAIEFSFSDGQLTCLGSSRTREGMLDEMKHIVIQVIITNRLYKRFKSSSRRNEYQRSKYHRSGYRTNGHGLSDEQRAHLHKIKAKNNSFLGNFCDTLKAHHLVKFLDNFETRTPTYAVSTHHCPATLTSMLCTL